HTDSTYIQLAVLHNDYMLATKDSLSLKRQTFELLPETKKILGYICHKAKTIINSNTIEIWYTTEPCLKGAPSVLGQELGLVLQTVRNGNFEVLATEVKKQKDVSAYLDVLLPNQPMLDMLTYRDI
ncbi:MAG: peptide-N-glycosidase, partial [Bacteroidota bacterium]